MAETAEAEHLLIVDMQQGFSFAQAEKIAPRIAAAAGHENWETVTVTCFRNPGAGSYFADEMRYLGNLGWTGMSENHDTDLIAPLEKLAAAKNIIWRGTFGGYAQQGWEEHWAEREGRIFLCGMYTDVSIHQMALEFCERNRPVKVLSDLVTTTHGMNVHQQALYSIARAIGQQAVSTWQKIVIEEQQAKP